MEFTNYIKELFSKQSNLIDTRGIFLHALFEDSPCKGGINGFN